MIVTEKQIQERTKVLTSDMYNFIDNIESIENVKSDGKQQLFWCLRKLAELELKIECVSHNT